MKIRHLVTYLPLAMATACVAAQQPMPDMPGMTMPSQSQSTTNSTVPNRTKQQPDATPGDIGGVRQDRENARAKAAGASEQNSIHQQTAQDKSKPGPPSDYESVAVPVQEMQEPESIELHTGSDLPAPELLGDIVNREPMTLADFIALADRSQPTLRQAQDDIERSLQQGRQVGLPPDPVIGYSGDHIRGGSYHGGEEGAFFSQEIVLGRKLALRRNVFRAQEHANELSVEVQRARIRNDVTRAFFDALSAQASVVVHDRLLKVALDTETNAHERGRIGQADADDVISAEIAAEQAKIDFTDAQRMFLAAFHQLATDSGQTQLEPHPLMGSLVDPPQIDAEAMVRTDMEQSPAIQQAQATIATEQARLKSAKREKVPDLYLKGGEWYSGEELSDAAPKRTGWMSFAEAGINIPLWNRNQGNVAAAKVLTDRAQQNLVRTKLWTRNRAEPFAQQYEQARFTADRYRTEMLPRARRAYQLNVMKYQQMAQPYGKTLEAQHMLFTLQLGYIHALHDEWTAATELQNYTLEGALDQPMGQGSDDTMRNLPAAGGAN